MKQTVIDILIYLFEHFVDDDLELEADQDRLKSELRDAGFTKLVKRDDGVYENVTASDGEARYMRRGRKETMPHLHKKIED